MNENADRHYDPTYDIAMHDTADSDLSVESMEATHEALEEYRATAQAEALIEQKRLQDSKEYADKVIMKIENATSAIIIGVFVASAAADFRAGTMTQEDLDRVNLYADSKRYAIGIKNHVQFGSSRKRNKDAKELQANDDTLDD